MKLSLNGAPILHGSGLASVRETIRQAFESVRADLSASVVEEVEVEIDESIELLEVIDDEVEIETIEIETETDTNRVLQDCLRVAEDFGVFGEDISSHRMLRRDLHRCYVIEAPTESASELFAQALRQLKEEK